MRSFTFLGFLPRRPRERSRALATATREPRTTIFFESPHRLRATLGAMHDAFGERRLVICRELTKAFEETFRGNAAEALAHFQEPRGEFTIVIDGFSADVQNASEATVRADLQRLQAMGATAKDAVATVAAANGLPKRQVYRLWLDLRA
jgi:16S rRNA (cytidine1402-2'-O)-methyltransferase